MQYEVLRCSTPGELVAEVQALIDAGWRPVGGIAFDFDGRALQAMTLEVS